MVGHVDKDTFDTFLHGKRIAVVGNANSVRDLAPTTGAFVDGCDVVIRMNMGVPLPSVVPFIGRRTDIWAVNMRMDFQRTYQGQFRPYKYAFVTSPKLGIAPEIIDHAFVIRTEFDEAAAEVGWKTVSSGLRVLRYLIRNIDYKELVVLGFDFFRTPDFYRDQIVTTNINPTLEEAWITRLLSESRDITWLRSFSSTTRLTSIAAANQS